MKKVVSDDYEDKGHFLYHTACDKCGSSDANSVYSDGSTKCYSCGWFTKPNGQNNKTNKKPIKVQTMELLDYDFRMLKKRNIPLSIVQQYKYGIGKDKHDNGCQVANYYNKDKEIVAQKLRYPDKTFRFIGNSKEAGFYGQQLWGDKGRKLVITEGEVDALSVATAFEGKYPVVSLKNGAQSAKKEIAQQLTWITGYDEVYLWFDNDEPGRKALDECVPLLPVDKVRIIRHSECKDANELLIKHGTSSVIKAFYSAESYKPADIATPDDLLDSIDEPIEEGFPWYFKKLTELTYGRRYGEVVVAGAGVSVGKTDFVMTQIAHDISNGHKVGTFMLEQSMKETLLRIAGKTDGCFYHLPKVDVDKNKLKETVHGFQSKLFLYDNFGSTEWEAVREKIRYMHHNYGVRIFYIDNLTALNSHAADERRNLDALMAEVAGLAKELDVWVLLISHLNPPKTGASHESGGKVEQNQFTGSRAIMRWAFFMFGIERNTLHPDPIERNKGIIRCIKDRFSGQATGQTVGFVYDGDTGLCLETEEMFEIERTDDDEQSDY